MSFFNVVDIIMRYSCIANNHFSYILTLDEFRNQYEEKTRPSFVKITTITMVSKYHQPIDIQRLRGIFEKITELRWRRGNSRSARPITWSLGSAVFYNQITLRCVDEYNSTKSVKIFPNGSIQCAGCTSLFDCQRIINQLSQMLRRFVGVSVPAEQFRVVMINSNFSLNRELNLIAVYRHFVNLGHGFLVSFEPERYSAVKIKFQCATEMKQITASIFATGKVIITGATTLKEIAFGYNVICSTIEANPSLVVRDSSKMDVFDKYMGYDATSFIRALREKGHQSWMRTIENKQINFSACNNN